MGGVADRESGGHATHLEMFHQPYCQVRASTFGMISVAGSPSSGRVVPAALVLHRLLRRPLRRSWMPSC